MTFGGLGILWNTTFNLFYCCIDSNISNQPIVDINYGSSVKMYNCTVRSNSAIGIHVDGSNLQLINSLVSNNADYGIWAVNSNDTVINSTIVFNQRGIHSQVSQFNIINSIIFFNTDKQIYLASAPIPNISYCNIQNRLSGGIVGAVNWGNGNIDLDPDFVDTTLKDCHLTMSSPCIAAATLNSAPTDDLDGNTRPLPAGTFPDMGAYEFDQGTNSIAETLFNKNFIIYPNPTKGSFYLNNTESFESIKITNAVGMELTSQTLINQNSIMEFDLSSYPPGIYFVQISINNFFTFKEIKN